MIEHMFDTRASCPSPATWHRPAPTPAGGWFRCPPPEQESSRTYRQWASGVDGRVRDAGSGDADSVMACRPHRGGISPSAALTPSTGLRSGVRAGSGPYDKGGRGCRRAVQHGERLQGWRSGLPWPPGPDGWMRWPLQHADRCHDEGAEVEGLPVANV